MEKRTKIQSHSFICELVSIGHHCFIGHGVMFINDLFQDGAPAAGDKTKWRETKIGNHVSIGSNATLLPVTICDHVVIGAGAVVTKNITEPGTYAGNPARRIRQIIFVIAFMNIPFVDLKAQYNPSNLKLMNAIACVIDQTSFIGGSFVSDFEKNFAAAYGVKTCDRLW